MPQIAAEHCLADPIPVEGMLCANTTPREKTQTTTTCTTNAWVQIRILMHNPTLYSPLLPHTYHPSTPLLQETVFRKLKERAKLTTWGDLYHNGIFCTSEQMFKGFQPSPLDIFLYV